MMQMNLPIRAIRQPPFFLFDSAMFLMLPAIAGTRHFLTHAPASLSVEDPGKRRGRLQDGRIPKNCKSSHH